jgi:outer membrane protein OmpA-like peptidoglycan-associated protein
VISALKVAPGTPLDSENARRSIASIDNGLKALAQMRTELGKQPSAAAAEIAKLMASAGGHIREAEASVSAIAGFPVPVVRPENSGAPLSAVSESLSAQAERLASISLAAAQVIAVKRSIPPPPVIPVPVELTPRDRLVAFSRAYAIFFSNEVDLKLPQQSNAVFDKLAGLMKGNDILMRVVGYTDNQGTPEGNNALSAARSKVVIDALKERGVPTKRFVPVARVDAVGISQERGAGSPNRRVEFEVGFEGENTP